MNNSNLMNYSETRSDRRRQEKNKRKTVIRLISMEKTDKRTYKNLKAVFDFIGSHEEFTGPQIQKAKGLKGPALYSLLEVLESRGLIEETGRIRSAGRGETKVYRLTLVGKIVASYVNNDKDLLVSTLRQIAEKTTNPLKRFMIEAFIENYPSSIMQEILEISISKVKDMEEGFGIDDLLSFIFEDAFIMILFLESKGEIEQIFRKNAELMERSPFRDWIFLFFKTQLESHYLYQLEGEKLAKYADSLKLNPQFLHIPCYNPECTNVIVVDSLLKISIPPYCEECKKRESDKPH